MATLDDDEFREALLDLHANRVYERLYEAQAGPVAFLGVAGGSS